MNFNADVVVRDKTTKLAVNEDGNVEEAQDGFSKKGCA